MKYYFYKPKLLFIGINPHHGSLRRGVPFSNNKLLWYLFAKAGLIKEDIADLRDDRKLKKIYSEKFNKEYGLGLINIIDRPTRDVTELFRGEEAKGRKLILKIIKTERPPVVCFIGKVTYEKFSGSKNVLFGWQPDIFSSRSYVMHFPLRGEASVRVRELRIVKRAAGL